jgi:PAS domain S-box-containing protein
MTMNDDKQKSTLFLLSELLGNILSYASDPGQCGDYITTQVRELIGAKIVALLHAPIIRTDTDYGIVSVCPSRYADTVKRREILKLAELSADATALIKLDPADPINEGARIVSALGFGESYILPLKAGGQHVGALLLLDLLSTDGIGTITSALQSLAEVIGLVFRNSMLYQSLDLLVEERTIALEKEVQERKKAERSLRESEKLFRSTFVNAVIGMCLVSLDGVFRLVNPAFGRMLGYAPPEIEGKPIRDLTHPDDIELSLNMLETLLAGNQPALSFEKRYLHKSGETVWTKAGTILLRSDDGTPEYFITHIEDITAQKNAEQEQRKLEEQLRQAHKMEAIGTLAGGIAHDFNNLLAAILGYAEMATDDIAADAQARHHIEQVITAGNRAKALVQQILSFSRKEARTLVPVEIATIVKEALKLLRSSIPTTVEIRQAIDSGCGTILADPVQIHQVLMNLCTNAAQAMDEYGGILRIDLAGIEIDSRSSANTPDLEPGRYIMLTVQDNGAGIDEKIIDRIFDPYFTTKAIGKGSGMGLSVVMGIVKSHRGAITVSSSPGKGTAFHVYFPRIEAAIAPRHEVHPALPSGSERILVVDDDIYIADLTRRRIERLGYRATMETDSKAALELFRSSPKAFDLVISDQTMPHLTGEQLAREILAIRPDMPIIICSGYSSKMDDEKAKTMGIGAFIMKPVELGKLARIIRQVLDDRTAARK